MRHAARLGLIGALASLGGCGDGAVPAPGADASPSAGCAAGERSVAGRCVAAGVQDDGCLAGEVGRDGKCEPAGVPPEACAEGFEPDGAQGCEPVLPASACPPGLLAVPGETRCREVAPCTGGRWGRIPVEPTTQYVDASYGGGDSDGSAEKPWTELQHGIDAASPGAIVAIGAGTYAEDLVIQAKPVRLWGRCPAEVEIVGTSSAYAAALLADHAGTTEMHDLAITGSGYGVALSGVEGVVLDHVWIHDTGAFGIDVEDVWGPTSIGVRDTLVEGAHEAGLYLFGTMATLERSVVRRTRSSSLFAIGIIARVGSKPSSRAAIDVRASIVEGSEGGGVLCSGCEAKIDASVVRDTQPVQGLVGIGISAESEGPFRSKMDVVGSVVSGSHTTGVNVTGSDVTIDSTVIRDTLPQPADLDFGRGIAVSRHPISGERGSLLLRRSVVEHSSDGGVFVTASDATLEASIVRDTLGQASNGWFGRGVGVQSQGDDGATAIVRACAIEASHDVGVFVGGSEATIEGSVIRDTLPALNEPTSGAGVGVESADNIRAARIALRACLVENNSAAGVFVYRADAIIEATRIRQTKALLGDGFGDGVTIGDLLDAPTSTTLTSSRIERNARAGLSSFGGRVSVGTTAFACNQFDIEAETLVDAPAVFVDAGGNACSCEANTTACQAVSAALAPPDPLTPDEQ